MADWASLLPEHVQTIADCVLSSTDGAVDTYMDMRAVCASWRSAITKPSPLAAITDLRFRPRHWVMVDLPSKYKDDGNDDACLFLHVLTGRFRWLRLPALHDHIIVGVSEGLLVFGDRDQPPNLARVLNPLTGDMLNFAASFHEPFADISSTAVIGGSHPRLVLWGYAMVVWAAPTSDKFTEMEIGNVMTTMGTFQGNVYVVDLRTQVSKFVTPAGECDGGVLLVAKVPPNVDAHSEVGVDNNALSHHLVESAGKLLLIRHRDRAVKVFRVDVERKLLEEVKSLGGCHALFLGHERCISVDASTVIYVDHPDRPLSLVQVLLRYCDLRGL
jgi:hypothetical protein